MKKSYYNVKQFRISEENYKWLLSIKKGTWNYTFNNLKKEYEENNNSTNEGLHENKEKSKTKETKKKNSKKSKAIQI